MKPDDVADEPVPVKVVGVTDMVWVVATHQNSFSGFIASTGLTSPY
ncbi:unnamed protein product [Haemonchus placei]|uniref:Uncharacterized protein n=1 Tax=Haemonchus placei TaxID=6290 RepID=A0A3P7YQD0_HAEPC|nr:unnamed protein product [Haemonchus placei]